MAITYGTGVKGNEADLEAILESNRSFNLDVSTSHLPRHWN